MPPRLYHFFVYLLTYLIRLQQSAFEEQERIFTFSQLERTTNYDLEYMIKIISHNMESKSNS